MSAAAPVAPASKLADYWRLMRFDRPIGIWLLLWPTLWGLWFAAAGPPPVKVLVIFVLGTVLMRAAGCVVNDWADRDFDPHVARTRERPVAAGRVAPSEALRLFVVLCLVAFGLVSQLNLPTVLLSLPAVAIAASYPFAKRYHALPQAHLGLAFAWGIPMAFAATGGEPTLGGAFAKMDAALCAVLVAATVAWAIAYDTFYAMVDRADDLAIGVKSSAILFGRHDRLVTALLQALTLALLAVAGVMAGRGAWYAAGLAAALLLAAHQQWRIRARDPAACFRAFLDNHRFGAVIFAGLALDCLWQAR